MQFEEWEEKYHMDRFCIFAKVAIGTMSNLVGFILATSWTNMEAQEVLVLQFHLNLVSREREWSI